MQPSEFWQLPVYDWWVELDAKIVESRRIEEMTSGKATAGGFTKSEWDKARRMHKEKMNDRTQRA